MPDPVDTLNVMVEAAVAIAGFTGVVVVFGRRATGDWSELDLFRIRNLLRTSFTVLFLSLTTLLLLHAGIASETTWRVGSALWSVSAVSQIIRIIRFHHTTGGDPENTSTMVIVLVVGAGLSLVILNLGNSLIFSQFWPFLAAQVFLFAAACFTFTLLLLPGRGGPAV